MKETSDADLAHEYIEKWSVMRKNIQRNDETETSLEVIEGHLNAIRKRLYPRKPKRPNYPPSGDLGWRDYDEELENQESEYAIRIAQGQLMRVFKIRWKETQPPNLFRTKYEGLKDECRKIVAASKTGKDGLPTPLTAAEASKSIRRLEILYAAIPYTTASPLLDENADPYEFRTSSLCRGS